VIRFVSARTRFETLSSLEQPALTAFTSRLGTPYWSRGDLALYLGDCLEVMKSAPDGDVALTVTSPPYNIGKEYESTLPLAGYLEWTSKWVSEVYRITAPTGALWLNLGYVSLEGRAKAIPLPYLLFTSVGAVWIINAGAGIAWAGYNLVSFNHMLSASENKNRARLSAYASTVTGVVVFSMTLLGGVLATRLPVLFSWRLQTLFLVSALVRIATFSLFFPRFHEYAPPGGERAQDLFNQIPGYRVGLGLLRNFFRAFRG